MLDESDLKKISEQIEKDRKERQKKQDIIFWPIFFGLIIGMIGFALGVGLGSDNQKELTGQNSLADQEIAEIQNMSCGQLKAYVPEHANASYAILELLQRCY